MRSESRVSDESRFETALPLAGLTRRRTLVLGTGAAVLAATGSINPALAATASGGHFPFGPVTPIRRIKPWPVVTQQARSSDLYTLFRGRVSAVQLMFTGCSATCPIQGALFAEAQQKLQKQPGSAQFVSISIDPLSDTPAALASWLQKFSPETGWTAVAPNLRDVDAIIDLLGSGGEPRPKGDDPHTGQVFIVNRNGDLVFRTPSLPAPEQIVSALKLVDKP